MALRISFSIATNQYVVGRVSVEVLSWRHSTTRGCAGLVRASIVLWYRSADVTTSVFRTAANPSSGNARVTRQILTESPTGFLQDPLPFVRELLAKQDGGVLREGIRALSEALMEMEV